MAKYAREHGKSGSFKLANVPPRFKEIEEHLSFPDPQSEGPMLPADISGLGYRISFIDEVFGGYRINVLREDGSTVAHGVNIRRFWMEQSVDDRLYDNTVAIKLSLNSPQAVRITVYGDGKISKEKIVRAIDDLSDKDKIEIMGAAVLLGKAAAQKFSIEAAVPLLAKCLMHESRGVRVDAGWALGEYAKHGGDIGQAEGALLKACSHEHGSTRMSAARALMHFYTSEKDEQKMTMLLNHPHPDVRSTANGVMERRRAI